MDVEAQHLEEGNEIVISFDRNDFGIVEDVTTRWAAPGTRTTITLTDGRTFTVASDRKVAVLS